MATITRYIQLAGVLGAIALGLSSCGGKSSKSAESRHTEAADSTTPITRHSSLPSEDTIRLVFVGDIMTHGPQIAAATRGGGRYDFSSSFALIADQIQRADLAVGNLETTFGGSPYTGYPQFSSPEALGWALRDVGFDVLTTANNHSCDRGRRGVLGTLAVLDSLGIATTGSYRNAQERAECVPLILPVRGHKLALLAYTYGTNGMPQPHPAIVDTINRAQIARDLARADSLGADYKVVQIHWGIEYQQAPNQAQRSLAHWLAQQGVQAIIGSHPHVVQSSEYLAGRDARDSTFVIYSLGNFVSNQNTPAGVRGGMLLELSLTRGSNSRWRTTPRYQYTFVEKRTAQGEACYRIHPASLQDSADLGLSPTESRDLQAMRNYYRQTHLVN